MSARASDDVRRVFLDYFRSRDHEVVASASLVPGNDPSLLFTNAGMVQFKDVFTGQAARARPRAASAQKCVRAGGKHNDLENVGRTARHHTFFEMLGNFSFGDYFKEDAIAFGYQLLVKEYALDPHRLIYTVHHTDGDARAIWKKVAGVGDDRVVGLGDKDNFWVMGDTGPCGPCSEVHYRQGGDEIPCAEVAAGRTCLGPACDCDRWIEIWNLVFMQFEQLAGGARRTLPRPSVDTGMGLERLCAVLGGFRSSYETDLLRPLVDRAAALSGQTFSPGDYGSEAPSVSLRAIADHARTTAFLIADGVLPEKTGRPYVLRRIMRRAIYHGWLLRIEAPFLATLAGDVIDKMGGAYPELRERRGLILEVTEQEERRFRDTLDRGVRILDESFEELRAAGTLQVPGDTAFKLYDTYGFPMDLTRVIAGRAGFPVDEPGFEAAMEEQRNRSEFRGSGEVAVESVFRRVAARAGATSFVGYENTAASSEIVALIAAGQEVGAVGPGAKDVGVVTRATPFYGEQGGQIGDSGALAGPRGQMRVRDCQRPVSTLYVHLGTVESGELRVGDPVELVVDAERRDAIRRNHSATHLAHWALRYVLGEHVAQKGSLVAPDRLRFDFSHFAPLTVDERRRVEDLVNERIRRNVAAEIAVLPLDEAKRAGAMAFFGEKYGAEVRVLRMGESQELCGGTHVARTGDIAFFKITDESGIAQGVRRLEAVTGAGALEFVRRLEGELAAAGSGLRAGLFEVAAKIGKLQETLRDREREIDALKRRLSSERDGGGGNNSAEETMDARGRKIRVFAAYTPVADPRILREAADRQRSRELTVSFIAGKENEKFAAATSVSADLVDLFHAGKIFGELAKDLGGRGGGRADLAQGGGQADKLPSDPREMVSRVKRILERS